MDDINQIEELLPFYVNGTLEDAEVSLVETALSDSKSLREQVKFLQELRGQMQAEEPAPVGGELGLARLMREIGDTPKAANIGKPPAVYFSKLAAGLAAAAIALAFGAGFSIRPEEPVYFQASGDFDINAITVSFQPDVSQALVAQTLLAHGLVIVDGPSASGYYRLSLFDDGNIDAAAEALRAISAVFDFVDDPE